VSNGPGRARITAFGDAALMIVLGDEIDPAVSDRAHRIAAAIRQLARDDRRFGQPIPAYATVLVPIDPRAKADEIAAHLEDMVSAAEARTEPPPPPRRHEIPTRYGGEDGPDLDELAAMHGLRPADVVELHASVDYRVYMLGFAPGFAYLGRVPAEIAAPRRPTPRQRVAAGSVAIARDQTGIYPFETPAGWNVIGRTALTLWDPTADPPALFAPGDSVRFVPIR
jgi:KipI family sensor histidine kinase inhibitor